MVGLSPQDALIVAIANGDAAGYSPNRDDGCNGLRAPPRAWEACGGGG